MDLETGIPCRRWPGCGRRGGPNRAGGTTTARSAIVSPHGGTLTGRPLGCRPPEYDTRIAVEARRYRREVTFHALSHLATECLLKPGIHALGYEHGVGE